MKITKRFSKLRFRSRWLKVKNCLTRKEITTKNIKSRSLLTRNCSKSRN